MRAVLEQGLKETSILNPSDFGLTPLHITGFLILQVFGEYQYKFHEFSPIPAFLGDDSIFQPYGKPEELKFDFLEPQLSQKISQNILKL